MSKVKGIGAIIIGLLLTFGLALPELKTMMAPGQDIYSVNINEIEEGDHIVGNIDCVFDYYAVESVKKSTMGVTTSTSEDTARWYAVPVYGESTENPKIITVKVYPSGYECMDKKAEETYALDARVVKLQDDLYPLYYEWYGTDYRECRQSAYAICG